MRQWPQAALGRFRVGISNNFFMEKMVRHWDRLMGGEVPIPGVFKKCVDWQ